MNNIYVCVTATIS